MELFKIIQCQNATAQISPKLSCGKQPKACENKAVFKATVFFCFQTAKQDFYLSKNVLKENPI